MSKRKYKKGERILTLEELDRQEFVFFQNKVYHKGFWQSWQYRWVLEKLKIGQFFKAYRADAKQFLADHVLSEDNIEDQGIMIVEDEEEEEE